MNLYAYAGNNPVAYSDPLGLAPRDVTFASREAEAAYTAGKHSMSVCAGGASGSGPCTRREAMAAAMGLAILAAAENDRSVEIHVVLGEVPGHPDSPGGNGGGLGRSLRGVFVNPTHETMGRNYDLDATVIHEVIESYGMVKAGNLPNEGSVWQGFHSAAIVLGEDPVLTGKGLPTRTSRTTSGSDRPVPY